MNFFEWLLAGLGFRRLQRPVVFIAMTIATLFFGGIAVTILILMLTEFRQGAGLTAVLGFGGGIVLLFVALAVVSGYMVKRCFDPD